MESKHSLSDDTDPDRACKRQKVLDMDAIIRGELRQYGRDKHAVMLDECPMNKDETESQDESKDTNRQLNKTLTNKEQTSATDSQKDKAESKDESDSKKHETDAGSSIIVAELHNECDDGASE